jgi:hypothetical protein
MKVKLHERMSVIGRKSKENRSISHGQRYPGTPVSLDATWTAYQIGGNKKARTREVRALYTAAVRKLLVWLK